MCFLKVTSRSGDTLPEHMVLLCFIKYHESNWRNIVAVADLVASSSIQESEHLTGGNTEHVWPQAALFKHQRVKTRPKATGTNVEYS